jgi:hypothetical protein
MLLFEPNQGGQCLCDSVVFSVSRTEFHLECGRYE